MYIGHVSDCFLPRLGGIEWQVHDLAVRQYEAGHRVEVVTGVPGGEGPPGVLVHRPAARRRSESISYLAALQGCDVALDRGYDVLHVHASTFSPLAYLTARAGARAGVPVVVTGHSLWSYATPIFRLADRGLGWAHWPVEWSAVSTVAAEPLRALLPPGRPVTVLPNGVDRAEWDVEPVPRSSDDVHIVSVLRFARRKRPLDLVDMLSTASRLVPDSVRLRATLVGDGPLLPATEGALRRAGMDEWVQLPGRLGRTDIAELFARADIYVAPADLESFGIAALEARCAGLPVVGKRNTGLQDFIRHGTEGLLADSDEELVQALALLAARPEQRIAMAEHNRSQPPKVGWEHILETCEALYGSAARRAEVFDEARCIERTSLATLTP
ncbi:MAG: glycosyltransferase family 4 protein [Actinomycetes bacterium]